MKTDRARAQADFEAIGRARSHAEKAHPSKSNKAAVVKNN